MAIAPSGAASLSIGTITKVRAPKTSTNSLNGCKPLMYAGSLVASAICSGALFGRGDGAEFPDQRRTLCRAAASRQVPAAGHAARLDESHPPQRAIACQTPHHRCALHSQAWPGKLAPIRLAKN